VGDLAGFLFDAIQEVDVMLPPHTFDCRVAILNRPEDIDEFRCRLQHVLGLNHIDAGTALTHVPGVLPQRLTSGQAAHVSEQLRTAGIAVEAVRADEIPDFEHAESVHHVRCTPAALDIADLDGGFRRSYPWIELRLVSIGLVPLDETRTYTTDNVFRASPVRPDPYVTTGRRERLECWLIFDNPLQVLRFDSGHMRYDRLDHDAPTAGSANFELLAGTVLQHAGTAVVTRAARAYCNHGPVIDYEFVSSAALKQHTLAEYLKSLARRRA
jgi:hypothetical protein